MSTKKNTDKPNGKITGFELSKAVRLLDLPDRERTLLRALADFYPQSIHPSHRWLHYITGISRTQQHLRLTSLLARRYDGQPLLTRDIGGGGDSDEGNTYVLNVALILKLAAARKKEWDDKHSYAAHKQERDEARKNKSQTTPVPPEWPETPVPQTGWGSSDPHPEIGRPPSQNDVTPVPKQGDPRPAGGHVVNKDKSNEAESGKNTDGGMAGWVEERCAKLLKKYTATTGIELETHPVTSEREALAAHVHKLGGEGRGFGGFWAFFSFYAFLARPRGLAGIKHPYSFWLKVADQVSDSAWETAATASYQDTDTYDAVYKLVAEYRPELGLNEIVALCHLCALHEKLFDEDLRPAYDYCFGNHDEGKSKPDPDPKGAAAVVGQ